jgi:hypothetical protein
MKVVINRCYGGFGLSEEGVKRYAEIKGITLYSTKEKGFVHYSTMPANSEEELNKNYWSYRYIQRNDPALVQVVEELGKKAGDGFAELEIIDIPFDSDKGWHIEEYDGMESIHEDHQTWQ